MKIITVKKWHLFILWPAFIACILYVISAFSHPLMAWTGPQARVMFPPSLTLEKSQFESISVTLAANKLQSAKIAKLVPYRDAVLLQVTETQTSARRYFSLISTKELQYHDETQAVWLASHYLKRSYPVNSIELKTTFDQDYPSVNRLLPVYKINFDTPDNLSVYIHTDTQALAGIENDWKRSLRFIFQTFHTFNWLDDYEPIRLLVITILLSSLIIMGVTGLLFLIKLKRKGSLLSSQRRWHRRLSWFLVIPFLLFCVSGTYHLWQSSLVTPPTGLQLTQTLDLTQWPSAEYINLPNDVKINQVSLIQAKVNQAAPLNNLYRLSISPIQTINTRQKRFIGQSKEKSALYINANNGSKLGNLDKSLVEQQARNLLGESTSSSLPMKLITHFGLGYDFRNKRLPVWRVEGSNDEHLFIDPVTHILVDKNNALGRLEGYSFSFLHKWNMLTPITGRFNRDILILLTLGLIFILASFGLMIRLRSVTRSKERKERLE